MSNKEARQFVEISSQEMEQLLERVKTALPDSDFVKIAQIIQAYLTMTQLVGSQKTTLARLRQLLFGASTESLDNILKTLPPETAEAVKAAMTGKPQSPAVAAKGHGRNGAQDYSAAKKVKVPLETVKAGQRCPECKKGKLYDSAAPGLLVRVTGQAPLGVTVYELEKLRCNLCGQIFTAPQPAGIGEEKYDAGAGSMIAMLKYGGGMPFNRLENIQGSMGLPLPASTQWEIVEDLASVVEPAHCELCQQAAQAAVLHNDDTGAKILELGDNSTVGEVAATEVGGDPLQSKEKEAERTGVFTSGIVAVTGERKIALYYTGHKHAGENLIELLKKRSANLAPPIQMCDALSRNMPKELATILANCNSHARRKFVDVAVSFPLECLFVIEILRKVYQIDARAKEQSLSATARLELHQAQSMPLMDDLATWMKEQVDTKKVEPNSGLGEAIQYMRKHWVKLTLFLREAGAPLDNNICERILKKSILHRKNALFYKTLHGAHVGDIFMSIIQTCQLTGVSPFEYLNTLQEHRDELKLAPSDWMPWNYKSTVDGLAAAQPMSVPAS